MVGYNIFIVGGLLLDPAMRKALERKVAPKEGEKTPVNTDYLSASFASTKKIEAAIAAALETAKKTQTTAPSIETILRGLLNSGKTLDGLLVVTPIFGSSPTRFARKIRNENSSLPIAVLEAEAPLDSFEIGYFAAGLAGAGDARQYFLDKPKPRQRA